MRRKLRRSQAQVEVEVAGLGVQLVALGLELQILVLIEIVQQVEGCVLVHREPSFLSATARRTAATMRG